MRKLDRIVKIRPPGAHAYNRRIDTPPVVLVLCTGNICRSPMAEGLLRARLAAREVPVTVMSAGLSFDGRPATPEAVAAIAVHGADIAAHTSRIISRSLVAGADLIIAMERLHAREAVLIEPGALGRTFTLKELVRRAAAAGSRQAGETLEAWLARIGTGRRQVDLVGSAAADDVDDPYRRAPERYAECAAELTSLIDDLVALAWPPGVAGVQEMVAS